MRGIKWRLQVASPWPGPTPQGPAGLRMARKNQAEEPSTDTQEAKSLPPPPATHPASFLAEVTEGGCEPLLLSASFAPLRGGPLPDRVAECWNKHLGCCQLGNGRQFLYHLSYKGSPRILEWVAYPFPSSSSRPRNQTRVSCIAGRFFTN